MGIHASTDEPHEEPSRTRAGSYHDEGSPKPSNAAAAPEPAEAVENMVILAQTRQEAEVCEASEYTCRFTK